MLYNVYCDETCHLENDGINVMVLGAVWCPQRKLKEINQRINQVFHDFVNPIDKDPKNDHINNSSSATCRRSS